MKEIVCVNGKFMPSAEAKVSIFDRGLMFADSVYDCCPVAECRLINWNLNRARIERSTQAINLCVPERFWTELDEQVVEVIKLNKLREGYVYVQVTRGIGERAFTYLDNMIPTTIVSIGRTNIIKRGESYRGIAVCSVEDLRWGWRDVKTTQLLYQVIARMEAKRKCCQEAWFVSRGLVTEAASANAYIVQHDGAIVTRPVSREILAGCTREALLSLCRSRGLKVDERAFSLEEALAAREAFITSAMHFVTPVISIDGQEIGNGKIGVVTTELHEAFLTEIGV
ncbi:aminotransferase class IV [Bradyrhizobium diazoefficiens]|uniref:aminotransferase class IV n=1 Tax=Bradyrhizobium diazoefficiens TaxID=1355477 RepID=UPI00190B92A8|nr:aminotransferase class IV [Bradyrhizobium diazoefficiens]MBK3662758.1 aminotransferase class IV [Bradyrhizobium diazoefficiens]